MIINQILIKYHFGSICQYAKSMENLNHLIWKRGIFALCAKIEVF